jgi:hypothetical protein
MSDVTVELERLRLIASRLTVDGLAEALHNAENFATGYDVPWAAEVESEKRYTRVVAERIISHITGPEELERLSRPTGKSLGLPGPEANADAATPKSAATEQVKP